MNGPHAAPTIHPGIPQRALQRDASKPLGARPAARRFALLGASLLTLLLPGCQTPPVSLGTYESSAVQVAVQRARFDLVCNGVTGTVVSSALLQPTNWGGGERAEYVVRVEGCGQRGDYRVVCGTHDLTGRTSAGQMTWTDASSVSCLAAAGGK